MAAHRNVEPQRLGDERQEGTEDHAQEARNLLERGDGFGLLSTLHAQNGYPFGSVVNYAVDEKGTILFLVSKLAEHYHNILNDNRVSLLVVDESKSSTGDRLALSRVTILGKAAILEKTDELFDVLVKRHPASAKYGKWPDFMIVGITELEHVRYIKGFGNMSWVSGEEFLQTKVDPVSTGSAFAVEHMNRDHKHHTLYMINAFSGRSDYVEAVLLRFDSLGFDALGKTPGEDGRMMPVRITFPEALKDASELRGAVTALTKKAEEVLKEKGLLPAEAESGKEEAKPTEAPKEAKSAASEAKPEEQKPAPESAAAPVKAEKKKESLFSRLFGTRKA